jgi:hypothetical protein
VVQVVLTGRGDVAGDPRGDEVFPQPRSYVDDADISHRYTVGEPAGISIIAGCG